MNGTTTVIADKFEGKPLNSPNDLVVHPDGSIWFTDPAYGINGNYEGFQAPRELKEAVYRVDGKTAQIEKVTEEIGSPNGLCFSQDYKKLYVADTGTGREIKVWDVDGKSLRNGKRFVQLDIPGTGAPAPTPRGRSAPTPAPGPRVSSGASPGEAGVVSGAGLGGVLCSVGSGVAVTARSPSRPGSSRRRRPGPPRCQHPGIPRCPGMH